MPDGEDRKAVETSPKDVAEASPSKADEAAPPLLATAPAKEAYVYSTREIVIIVFLMSMANLLAALDTTIVATASPVIVAQLNGMDLYSWIGTGYLLTSTAFQPLWGTLSGIFGRKRTVIFLIIVFLGGSAFCGGANTMVTLIIARAIQGIGGGGIFSVCYVVVSEIVPLRERGKYTGIIAASWTLASVLGPLFGGIFTDTISWRWAFLINLPFGVPVVAGVYFFLRLPPPKGNLRDQIKRVDFVGCGLFTVAITLLLMGLSLGGVNLPWNSAGVIICLVLPFVLLAAFVYWEMKFAKEPVIPMSIFNTRNTRFGFIAYFSMGCSMMGLSYFLAIYLQLVRGMTAIQSGLISLPQSVFVSIVIMTLGQVTSRTGRYLGFIWFGMTLIVMTMSLFFGLLNRDTSVGLIIGLGLVNAVGIGFSMQNLVLSCQASVPDRMIGPVSAVAIFLRTIGQTFGLAVFGAVFSNVFSAQISDKLVQVFADIKASGGDVGPLQALLGSSSNINGLSALAALKSLPYPAATISAVVNDLLDSYMGGVHYVYAVSIAFACAGTLASFGIKFIPLRKTSALVNNMKEDREAELAKKKAMTLEKVDTDATIGAEAGAKEAPAPESAEAEAAAPEAATAENTVAKAGEETAVALAGDGVKAEALLGPATSAETTENAARG